MEMKGDIASVVYTYENSIWYITGGRTGFSTPRWIHQSAGYVRYPVIKDNYVVWEEQIGDLTELYYSYLQYLQYDFAWTIPEKLFGYLHLDDRLPQIVWSKSYLCAVWTQGLEPRYTIPFERKEISMPPPYQLVDLGTEAPSPITIQRDGYIEYGPEAFKTVDYDSNRLIYHITGLDGSDKWTIKFILYHEGNNRWKERIRIDNGWTRNVWVYPYQVAEVEGIIPEAFIMDGEIVITVEVTQGDLAILSGIVFERESRGQGGPQSFKETKLPAEIVLGCLPNPAKEHLAISYSVPYPCEVKLSLYNALGQLVLIMDKGRREPGTYIVKWNNTDSNGSKISPGVYFLRLETPARNEVKKVVVLE